MTILIRCLAFACVILAVGLAPHQASAQSRDSLLNGAIIGAAVGAGVGIGFTYALRDSDLTAGQYGYGARRRAPPTRQRRVTGAISEAPTAPRVPTALSTGSGGPLVEPTTEPSRHASHLGSVTSAFGR